MSALGFSEVCPGGRDKDGSVRISVKLQVRLKHVYSQVPCLPRLSSSLSNHPPVFHSPSLDRSSLQ